MASMREWLKGPHSTKQKVIVVHCKAGKGRSGTVACSYLISEEGWTAEDALAQFTARRMRNGFGNGVSIPSQLRWVGYVDWWSKHGKVYVERQIEILEVHVWGLRDGVKVAIEGYVEEGKIIKTFHIFSKHERNVMDSACRDKPDLTICSQQTDEKALPLHESKVRSSQALPTDTQTSSTSEPGASAVIFRPAKPIILPTSDINIDFERRNKATYGFTMVTSVAHAWFNAFFESQYSSTSSLNNPKSPEPPDDPNVWDSGVFEIGWEAMDGIKGSARKGTRALDRLAVVWRAVPDPQESVSKIITQPAVGEPIPDSQPADWTKAHEENYSTLGKDLGMRTESPSSANVSKASSMVDVQTSHPKDGDCPSEAGVQSHIPGYKENISNSDYPAISISAPASLDSAPPVTGNTSTVDLGLDKVRSPSPDPIMGNDHGAGKVAGIADSMKSMSTGDLKTAEEHVPGQMLKDHKPLSS